MTDGQRILCTICIRAPTKELVERPCHQNGCTPSEIPKVSIGSQAHMCRVNASQGKKLGYKY